jgi:mannose-1-phosphate guanylyltransferase
MSQRDDSSHLDHFWAVIPAGGAGTRLWPLSRSSRPKFLLDLAGTGRTLIQSTLDRLVPLVGDRSMVITGRAHREAVIGQLDTMNPDHVVAEPSPRDSMAAIGLAAALLEKRDPESVMGSFAADHVIADPDEFARVVSRAVRVAQDGYLVTIGITPTGPATGFGYIEVGEGLEHDGAFSAAAFVEKPDAATAADYVERGFLWNAGMFVVRPGVLLDLLAETDPDFAAMLRAIAWNPMLLMRDWEKFPRISVDHAVAEPAAAAGRVAVVPGSFGWDDVGDFASLQQVLPSGADVTVLGEDDRVRAIESSGLVVAGGDRLVALVGLDDVVVVDTPDAVLVTTRERAQEVKRLVDELRGSGRDDLT